MASSPTMTNRSYKYKTVSHEEHRRQFYKKFNHLVSKEMLIEIKLDDEDMAYAEDFAIRVIEQKQKEKIHQLDGNNAIPRWMVGVLGEVALGKHLGVQIHDNSIGDTMQFTAPDLYAPLGIMCGVKTFRIGNFPLTNRLRRKNGLTEQAYPQVFVSVDIRNKTAYIHGVASVEALLSNESDFRNDKFVKDKTALQRKAAFTHFDTLKPFSDLTSLKEIVETTQNKKSYIAK